MKAIIFILAFFAFIGCKKDSNNKNESTTQTIDLGFCKSFPNQPIAICFEELITDSRCPVNANCIWQGVGSIKLKYTSNNETIYFRLRTRLANNNATNPIDAAFGRNDTTINGVKISLKSLTPYPSIPATAELYQAEIVLD